MRVAVIKDVNNAKIKEEEYKFKRDIELVSHVDLERLPITYHFDYGVIRYGNEVEAWIELKNRSFTSYQYPDSLINLSKWMKGLELYESTGIPSILGVRYTDIDLYYTFDKQDLVKGHIKVKWGARTKKTRDWQDIGPAVHIPISLFTDELDV